MTPVLLLAALVWLAETPSEDDWVCVASEDGKSWDCGRGANAPEPRPLPPPEPREEVVIQPLPLSPRQEPATPSPLADREGDGPSIFAPTDPTQPPQPPSRPPDGPAIEDGYTLQIASLTTPEDVVNFARNFDVDMARAGRATVMESGMRRHVLTFGTFDSPAAASAAADDLPPVLRALNPRVVSIDSLLDPPRPLLSTSPAASRTAGVSAADSDAATQVETTADRSPSEPEVALSAQPDPEPLAERPSEPEVTPYREPDPEPLEEPQRATEAPADTASEELQSPIPAVITEAEPAGEEDADPSAGAEPVQPPVRPAPTVAQTPPARSGWQPQGQSAFAQAQGRYTIQLANLRSATDVGEFLGRHGLQDGSIFVLPQTGGRQLVVYGRFDSLDGAESAMAGLPASLVAPWVRRADPLLGQ